MPNTPNDSQSRTITLTTSQWATLHALALGFGHDDVQTFLARVADADVAVSHEPGSPRGPVLRDEKWWFTAMPPRSSSDSAPESPS